MKFKLIENSKGHDFVTVGKVYTAVMPLQHKYANNVYTFYFYDDFGSLHLTLCDEEAVDRYECDFSWERVQ